jgi:hypothetical protein
MQAKDRRARVRRHSADPTRPRRLRCRGDEGAVLVEAAMVMPVLFLVLFGIFEFSGAMSSNNGASHTIRAGARVESAAANDPMADQAALARMATESAGLGDDEIDYIVIWHASSTSESPPANCLPGTFTAANAVSQGVSDGGTDALGACNIYVRPAMPGGAFDMASGRLAQPSSYYFGCTGTSDPEASHKVDCLWPPFNRQVKSTPRSVSPAKAPDLLGIYIRVEHGYVTGMFGDGLTITDKVITQLEPQGYSLS